MPDLERRVGVHLKAQQCADAGHGRQRWQVPIVDVLQRVAFTPREFDPRSAVVTPYCVDVP